MRLRHYLSLSLPVLPALLLSACGGGQSGPVAVAMVPVPPALRGTLVGAATISPVTLNAAGAIAETLLPELFRQLLDAAQDSVIDVASAPVCAVTSYKVRYNSVGAAGEATESSGAIMLPSGPGSACSGPLPVVLYAHGSAALKATDMANLDATEPRLIAAFFAAQGYIVVAPNYAGYAGSTLPYHPYLDAEQQAGDMIDALRAARAEFGRLGVRDSGKLYVTGYSQGGHVAVATQRLMQARHAGEFNLAAVAGLSGPYALAKFGDTMFGGAPTLGATAFLPLLITAGQRANAGLYSSSAEVYEAAYATGVETLLPGMLSLGDLAEAGKLPGSALFAADSLPQAAGAQAYFGAGNLIRTSYRNAYLADRQAHPCDAAPADPLNCAPAQGLRRWLLKNDLRSFAPAAPLLLCGGDQDPVVPFYNTEAAAGYYRAKAGSGAVPQVLNLDDAFGSADGYAGARLGFVAAKALVRAKAAVSGGSGDAAVRDAYHAGLVAPFCLRAARDFFRTR